MNLQVRPQSVMSEKVALGKVKMWEAWLCCKKTQLWPHSPGAALSNRGVRWDTSAPRSQPWCTA